MEPIRTNESLSPPPLTDFEIARLSRLFDLLLKLEKRQKESKDDLRTDNPN
ncbi:MAG TPA: hypothetical protein VFX17_03485 [Patescibacteria group bacterium]|nr:hypothetical protein [Patescibacteria group bacterium]